MRHTYTICIIHPIQIYIMGETSIIIIVQFYVTLLYVKNIRARPLGAMEFKLCNVI